MRLARGRNSSDRKRSRSRPSPASTTVSRMCKSNLVEHNKEVGENGRQRLLRLVDDEHRPRQRGIDVGLRALRSTVSRPAVVGTQFDAEQVAHLAIEIGKIALGPAGTPTLTSRCSESRSARTRKVTDLPAPGAPVTRAKPPSPTSCWTREQNEAMRGIADMKRLHRHVGSERIPFEAVKRGHLLVHVSSPCSSFGR